MKQKILFTFIESGFGHISSMESIYAALTDKFGDSYDIERCNIMTDDGLPHLVKMDKFIIDQVKNTNKYTLYSSSRIGLQRLFKHYERTCQVVFRKHIGHTHLVSAKTGCGVEP